MHYFQWNIKTYRADTAHLTNDEDLAYRRLIEHYYDTEQPIPTALPLLCRRLRLALPVVESVLHEFFSETPEGWIHGYIDSEIKSYHSFIARQKANGSKGGRGNKADAKPDKPTAFPDKPSAKPTINKEPLTTNHKPRTKNQEPGSKTLAPAELLASLGIDPKIAADWITLRRQKKAAITETALKGIQREADKAGMSLENALATSCERGWTGFKAEWVNKKLGKNPNEGRDLEAEMRAFAGEGNVIDGEAKDVG